jgi:hypothetical protein
MGLNGSKFNFQLLAQWRLLERNLMTPKYSGKRTGISSTAKNKSNI